jgi:hypothetical protein
VLCEGPGRGAGRRLDSVRFVMMSESEETNRLSSTDRLKHQNERTTHMRPADPLKRLAQGFVVERVFENLVHFGVDRMLERGIPAAEFSVVSFELRRYLEPPAQWDSPKISSKDSTRRNFPRRIL